MRKCPFGVAGQYVGPWFVGNVGKASSSGCNLFVFNEEKL